MMEENPRCHDFIRGLTEIVSAGGPKPEMVAAVKRLVTSFLATPGSLPERCLVTKPDCYARHLLHVDPAGRFSVVVMVWGPGQRTPIHDHGGMWCVEGVYRGHIRVTRYDLDAPVEDNVARFHRYEVIEAGVGKTGSLIPPVDFHTIENVLEQSAVTVHTYGGEMSTCQVFLPRPDGAYDACIKQLTYSSQPSPATSEV
jgi:predicted metal-dependent enzyme (double-stranded beta helix superfamily)